MSHNSDDRAPIDWGREFALAFGDGAGDELQVWWALDDERKALALQRLHALNLREDASVRASTTGLAKLAGMDRSHFYRLADRWAQSRTIGTLAPYLSRNPRAPGLDFEDEPDVRSRAESMLLAGASEGEIVSMIMTTADTSVSKPGARAWLRRLAAEMDGDDDNLTLQYGKKLVIDSLATNLVSQGSGHGEVMTACLVVEPASREIVGLALTPARDASRLLKLAVGSAVEALTVEGGKAASSSPGIDVNIVLPPMPDEIRRSVAEALYPFASVLPDGERRFGRLALPLLGKRIGSVWLRPRQTHDRPDALVTPEEADRRWSFVRDADLAVAAAGRAVTRHNSNAAVDLENRVGSDLFADRRARMRAALTDVDRALDRLIEDGVLPAGNGRPAD